MGHSTVPALALRVSDMILASAAMVAAEWHAFDYESAEEPRPAQPSPEREIRAYELADGTTRVPARQVFDKG